MRSLCLLRHAKSSWRDRQLTDHDRGLNKRGQRDAPRMGRALGQRLPPRTFYVSSARRAQLTFDGLMAQWQGLTAQHRVSEPSLYTFDVDDLLGWLMNRPITETVCTVIGHNPALTDLVNYLVGASSIDNVPTAGWIELSLPINDWRELSSMGPVATIDFTLFPRELSDQS